VFPFKNYFENRLIFDAVVTMKYVTRGATSWAMAHPKFWLVGHNAFGHIAVFKGTTCTAKGREGKGKGEQREGVKGKKEGKGGGRARDLAHQKILTWHPR